MPFASRFLDLLINIVYASKLAACSFEWLPIPSANAIIVHRSLENEAQQSPFWDLSGP